MQNLFSYPLKLEDMSPAVQKYELKASPAELEYITAVMQVPAVKTFMATVNVRLHKKEHLVDVFGTVAADVEQVSVVSLENFIQHYSTEFTLKFDTKMTAAEQKELELDIDADVPDILENGQIDLAAVAMEQLALLLDDFPRKEGEVFIFESEFDEETTKQNNPFAILEKLKK